MSHGDRLLYSKFILTRHIGKSGLSTGSPCAAVNQRLISKKVPLLDCSTIVVACSFGFGG